MRQVFEVLRLANNHGLSQRELARSLCLSQSTVHAYLRRFRASGLPWPVPPEPDGAAIEARLFTDHRPPTGVRPVPDCAAIQAELKRKGVTLQLLWIEYRQREPTGYQYTQFCQHYHDWTATIEPVLRQVYIAGEKPSWTTRGRRCRSAIRPRATRETRRSFSVRSALVT